MTSSQASKPAAKAHLTDRARKMGKTRVHLACISLGIVLAVLTTYIGGQFAHLAPVLPGLPSAMQELLDRALNF